MIKFKYKTKRNHMQSIKADSARYKVNSMQNNIYSERNLKIMGSIAIIIMVVVLTRWAFGGTMSSKKERLIKACNDRFNGKITEEEYNRIWAKETDKSIKKFR